MSLRGSHHARHHVDLAAARTLCDHCIENARANNWKDEFARFHSLLARIDLAEGGDATHHLDEAIRRQLVVIPWTRPTL